jgi:LacI family transcriptional regulator
VLGEERHLVIAESRADPAVEIRLLRKFQNEVDGLILYPTSQAKSTPAIQKFLLHGTPLVILDRVPEGVRTDAVMTDHEGATLQAIRTLEERGHRRIGFFSFDKPYVSSVAERHAGYQRALALVGVENVSALTRWFPLELDNNPQAFYQAIHDSLFTLLKQPEPITALFCVQDSFASAVLQACDQIGASVPGDLEIATFNDWPAMMLRSPWCLHRIVQRSYDIGRVAAELLLDQLQGNRRDPKVVRVPTGFVVADAGLRLSTFSK